MSHVYKPHHYSIESSLWTHEHINDRIEPTFVSIENFLNVPGYYWPVALLTAPLRVLYGACEVLFGLGLAFFKLCEATYKFARYSGKSAYLPIAECKAALSYMAHGAANIFRGFLEAAGIMTIWGLCSYRAAPRLPYAIEYYAQGDDELVETEDDDFDGTDMEPVPRPALGADRNEDLPFVDAEAERALLLHPDVDEDQ